MKTKELFNEKYEVIGTIRADGYIIKKADLLFNLNNYDPKHDDVDIYINADIMWLNNDNYWSHEKLLKVDLKRRRFIEEEGKEIQIINGQDIFDKIIKLLG